MGKVLLGELSCLCDRSFCIYTWKTRNAKLKVDQSELNYSMLIANGLFFMQCQLYYMNHIYHKYLDPTFTPIMGLSVMKSNKYFSVGRQSRS